MKVRNILLFDFDYCFLRKYFLYICPTLHNFYLILTGHVTLYAMSTDMQMWGNCFRDNLVIYLYMNASENPPHQRLLVVFERFFHSCCFQGQFKFCAILGLTLLQYTSTWMHLKNHCMRTFSSVNVSMTSFAKKRLTLTALKQNLQKVSI